MANRLFTAATLMAVTLQTAAVVMFFGALTAITLESFQIIPGPF